MKYCGDIKNVVVGSIDEVVVAVCSRTRCHVNAPSRSNRNSQATAKYARLHAHFPPLGVAPGLQRGIQIRSGNPFSGPLRLTSSSTRRRRDIIGVY